MTSKKLLKRRYMDYADSSLITAMAKDMILFDDDSPPNNPTPYPFKALSDYFNFYFITL